MPHKPFWYREIPAKLRWLEALAEPTIDRRAVELVFHVSQTEAQRIMRRVGAVRSGNGLICQRWKVIEWLRKVQTTEDASEEMERVERLESLLLAARPAITARDVRIPAHCIDPAAANLPAGISLESGKLTIEFFGAEDLLRHLFELSRVIAADYSQFVALAEGGR